MDRRGSLAGTVAMTMLLALVAAACSGNSGPTPRPRASGTGPAHPPKASGPPARRTCPVTRPNGSVPPGESASTPGAQYHGNGAIWTDLWQKGKFAAGPDDVLADGSIIMKVPWWRAVTGELRVDGRRLDGPAPPLRARISSYGPTGFQSTAVIFPVEGCWKVTGRAADASLSVVLMVVKQQRRS
jgi:hypothetical protein